MLKDIKKFYRRESFEKLMYGHVSALTKNIPISVDKAILNFMSFYDISEDEISLNSLRATYFRMQNEYFDSQKSDK